MWKINRSTALRTRHLLMSTKRPINVDGSSSIDPFTPKSDQCQVSPAASPEILHRTAWRTWLFIAYSDERWIYYQFSLLHLYNFSAKGWGNVLFELGSERVTLGSSEQVARTSLQCVVLWIDRYLCTKELDFWLCWAAMRRPKVDRANLSTTRTDTPSSHLVKKRWSTHYDTRERNVPNCTLHARIACACITNTGCYWLCIYAGSLFISLIIVLALEKLQNTRALHDASPSISCLIAHPMIRLRLLQTATVHNSKSGLG